MRLLLDEHYSTRIAAQLRERGHDAASVAERDDLRGLSDRELWARAGSERRTVVTENAADFMPLVREAAAAGERHPGVVFTSSRSLPRGLATIGVLVERLDALVRGNPAENAFEDRVHWLGREEHRD